MSRCWWVLLFLVGMFSLPSDHGWAQQANGIRYLAWSTDGTRLAAASYQTVIVYDVVGTQLTEIWEPGGFGPLAWSPDGRWLATGASSQTMDTSEPMVRVWDVEQREEVAYFRGNDEDILTMAFSPDGTLFVVGGGGYRGGDYELHAWNTTTWSEIEYANMNRNDAIETVAFSPDGRSVAFGGMYDYLPVCNAATGELLVPIYPQPDMVRSITFSPNSHYLALQGSRGIQVWEVRYEPEFHLVRRYYSSDVVRQNGWRYAYLLGPVAFGEHSEVLSVWLEIGDLIVVRDIITDQILDTFTVENATIALFSPGSRYLAVGNDLGEITLRALPSLNRQPSEDIPDFRPLTTIHRASIVVQFRPEYFAFNPDGTQIAAAATEHTVNIWDVATGDVIHILDHGSTSVFWSPNGALIATGNSDWSSRVWDAATGTLNYELRDSDGWYTGWSPDSARFVTNSGKIFDSRTGDLLLQLGLNWAVPYEVEWSPDGMMIASASGWEGDETILWAATGEYLDTFWTGHSISWSPDSTQLASFGQVRDITTGLPVTIIPGMYGEIAWHPNGDWVASAHDDMVYLWDAETGAQLAAWTFFGCDIRGFAWSRDGDRFAVNCLGDMSQPEFLNDLIIWERVR